MPLSSESSSSRIDWRPSRLLCGALLALGMLAGISLGLSALTVASKVPLVILAAGYGVWLARREAGRRPCSVRWTADGSGFELGFVDDIERYSAPDVLVRGPFAVVSGLGLDGRIRRLLWFPDTMPTSLRRRLRLAGSRQLAESSLTLATMSG